MSWSEEGWRAVSSGGSTVGGGLRGVRLNREVGCNCEVIVAVVLVSKLLSVTIVNILFFGVLGCMGGMGTTSRTIGAYEVGMGTTTEGMERVTLGPSGSACSSCRRNTGRGLRSISIRLGAVGGSNVIPRGRCGRCSGTLSS